MEPITIALATTSTGLAGFLFWVNTKLGRVKKENVEKQEVIDYLSKSNAISLMESVSPWDKQQSIINKVDQDPDVKLLSYQLKKFYDHTFKRQPGQGFVYVIHTPNWGKDVYKIGMTTQADPYDRIKSYALSNPIAPEAYLIYYSDEANLLEAKLHHWLKEYRCNDGTELIKSSREHFKVSLSDIEAAVNNIQKYLGTHVELHSKKEN